MISLYFFLTACKEEAKIEKAVARVDLSNDLIHSQPFTTDDDGIEVRHCPPAIASDAFVYRARGIALALSFYWTGLGVWNRQ